MRAAAVAQEVFRREPNHPGAAHYTLHAFDKPDHAVLGLPAARRYAEIAPPAHHALHMPSHIFLQLGMWPDAAASNEASWEASTELGTPDFHSLHWLSMPIFSRAKGKKRGSSYDRPRASPKFPQRICATKSIGPTSK